MQGAATMNRESPWDVTLRTRSIKLYSPLEHAIERVKSEST